MQIPYIYYLIKGTLCKEQQKLHKRYGDVIRIGPNEISFAKEDAWQDIYTNRLGHQEPTKNKVWYIG